MSVISKSLTRAGSWRVDEVTTIGLHAQTLSQRFAKVTCGSGDESLSFTCDIDLAPRVGDRVDLTIGWQAAMSNAMSNAVSNEIAPDV